MAEAGAAAAAAAGGTPHGSSPTFELCIAYSTSGGVSGRNRFLTDAYISCLRDSGLILEEEAGVLNAVNFVKVAAPIELIGRTAEQLRIRKASCLGLDLLFEWEQRDSFVRQAFDNSLFSWTERYKCIEHLLNRPEIKEDVSLTMEGDEGEVEAKAGEKMLDSLKRANVVKDVFPLHDQRMRKELLEGWGMNWKAVMFEPIDAVHAYFGAKVAIYFAFLGMYTKWLVPPALLALYMSYRSWGSAVPVFFSIVAVLWSVLFLQFWKRKNAALLTRWGMALDQFQDSCAEQLADLQDNNQGGIQAGKIHEADISRIQKQAFQKKEWAAQLKSVRNYGIVVLGILFIQLPVELGYAHLNKVLPYDVLKYLLTGVYLLGIQYFTKLGGRIAVRLTKSELISSREGQANALIYKVFGIYFMQSYIGLLYHALFHRDFTGLRHFLVQRLIIAQIMSNFTEVAVPYATYAYAKYQARKTEENEKKSSGEKKASPSSVEKEYMKPAYSSSIGDNLEDGLFDDFLELALQFGMVTMFACSFPLVFCFAFANNLIEIHSDAIKLLAMFRRPTPREAASIGAWLQIFQYLGVVAICTNCALLVCLYDEAGQWNVEPGMAAILTMEHLLLLAKFGFACFVPEEPAWVKAKRARAARLQEHYAMQVLKARKP